MEAVDSNILLDEDMVSSYGKTISSLNLDGCEVATHNEDKCLLQTAPICNILGDLIVMLRKNSLNCWKAKFIKEYANQQPSSLTREGSTTIPRGSTLKRVEAVSSREEFLDEDMVSSYRKL